MKHHYLIIPTVLLLITACTPLRVVRVEPEEATAAYSYGNKVYQASTDELAVAINYYDASPQYLVFDLAVENTGEEAFDFSPESCQLVPDIGPASPAIDPELQLLSMDLEHMDRQRNRRTWSYIGAGVAIAGIVAGSVGDPVVGGEGAIGNAFAEQLTLTTVDALVFAVVSSSDGQESVERRVPSGSEVPVPENRYFWLDHSLRVTTIRPGETAFGKVVFPRNDQATRFDFQVSVRGETFSFPFRQQVFR